MPKSPEIGDQVWFYFLHAFTDVKLQEGIWRSTGKYEMRCRPACVYEADQGSDFLSLRVEFHADDMRCHAGMKGLATRLNRDQQRVPGHFGSTRITNTPETGHIVGGSWPMGRIIGGCWPSPGTWAWDPMPGFEGGGR